MKQVLLLITLLVVSSCHKDTSNPTPIMRGQKGVFGLRDANKLQAVNAEYTRIIVWDSHLEELYVQVDNGIALENIAEYQQIKSIYDAGIKIILTLRWPDQLSGDPSLYDRVPIDQDKANALNLLARFLHDFGPLIEIYSVQNEVGGLGPGTYEQNDMLDGINGIPAIEWWKEIVTKINTEKANNPSLSHLKISAPVPIFLRNMVFSMNQGQITNAIFFHETIEFGNEYCDYLDFHFNTYALSEYEATLAFLNPLVKKPMISTEWSEVGSANEYIQRPISLALRDQANNLNFTIPSNVITNKELIEYLYDNPSQLAFWKFMVEESKYESDFMKQSSNFLFYFGFQIICWNSGFQEGLPAYDLRSFYATKTVSSPSNELIDFTSEFKNF